MKWLFITETAGLIGGIEVYAMRAAKALIAAGDTVELAYLSQGPMAETLLAAFSSHAPLATCLTRTYDAVFVHKLRSITLFKRVIQTWPTRLLYFVHDHDVICPRSYHYLPGKARKNCPYAYAPLRCTLCGLLRHPRNYLDKRFFCQFYEGFFGVRQRIRCLQQVRVVTNSTFMMKELQRSGINCQTLLPPFVTRPAHPAQGNTKEIIFVGQLIRGKGVHLLIEAIKGLTGDWRLRIIGDGHDRAWLETLAQGEPRIEFCGRVADTSPYYQAAGLLVFPSIWDEPAGMTLIEAAAWGLPTLVFDVGGVRDFVEDQVTGRLLPPRDVPAMRQALSTFIAGQWAPELGRQAREKSAQFSTEQFVTALRQLVPQT